MNLLFGKRWFSWPRLAGLAVTAALLVFIFRKIDLAACWASLRQMHAGWFALGFAAYGAALVLGAGRTHLALRLTERALHPAATFRLMLAAHFFFTVLFGAAGGELAKAAVYARWYQFGLPEVLAASPLDRGFGLGAAIVLAALTLGLAEISGGFAHLQNLELGRPGGWLLAGIGVAALAGIALLWRRPAGHGAWARTIRAFQAGGGRLVLAPRVAVAGLLWALACQAALSSVFAFSLRAVSAAEIPWAQVAWTFPAITTLSCLPFTVAGVGVREVAAITLLGLYGVPPADCVAAAMLTLILKVAWAGIGAGVFWREESFFAKLGGRPLPGSLSVVIPVLNEAAALPETVRRAQALPEVREIIVVDGGSSDATRAVAAELGCRVLSSAPGRGGQLRAGAAQAVGDVVLLLHADTWLPPAAGHAALNCLRDQTVVAGGFWKVFRDTPVLLLGSRWRCAVRLFAGRRILGDQAMFVRREVLEQIGGVPDMPLMEEFELCRRLRRVGRLALADCTIETSARRFERLGVVRTYLRMWRVGAMYRLGFSPQELRRVYERE